MSRGPPAGTGRARSDRCRTAPDPPPVVARSGPGAVGQYLGFFAGVRAENTRAAYLRAAGAFFRWAAGEGLALDAVRPAHVAAYVELLSHRRSARTVRQHLAALRTLFGYLVTGGVIAVNPAAAVRVPAGPGGEARPPVLSTDQAKRLLTRIDATTVVGLRDRALLGVLLYAFARAGAAVGMRVGDYDRAGRRVRLPGPGGRPLLVPCHPILAGYLDAYLRAAGLAADPGGPLFRTAGGRSGRLTGTPMTRRDAYRAVRRRAAEAGLPAAVCCETLRCSVESLAGGGEEHDVVGQHPQEALVLAG